MLVAFAQDTEGQGTVTWLGLTWRERTHGPACVCVCVCVNWEGAGGRLGRPMGPRRAFLSIWGESVRSGVKTALLVSLGGKPFVSGSLLGSIPLPLKCAKP